MRFLFFGLALIFSACSTSEKPESTGTQADSLNVSSSSDDLGLPPNAEEYLKSNFSGWSLAETTDYKVWWSFHDRARNVPYLSIADLNGDRKADYGIVLKNAGALKFVVLLGKDKTFTHWVAEGFNKTYDPGNPDISYGFTVEAPGRIDIVYPEVKSLILKSNAFNLMELENRASVFYWLDGKIAVFKTM